MAFRTIETDPISPFGEPEVPAAEWTYREWRRLALEQGIGYLRSHLGMASQRAGRTFATMPEWPRGRSLDRSVEAFVNDGRWLWECPVCRAAQVCAASDPRAFCVECFNAGDGWWPVEWPDAKTVTAAEHVLAARPSDRERNWRPSRESLRDLQTENLQRGVDPDAPGHMILGDAEMLARVKVQLQEMGYPVIEGPEDELLTLPPAKMRKALEARALNAAAERAAEREEATP